MTNLGGYDKNSFYDSSGVAYLTYFLQKEHTIKGIMESDDKIPNLDGTIQVLEWENDKKAVPRQIFHVQVKTLNCEYTNFNQKENKSQYKYLADTKVFHIVKKHITLDPVLLFLVDVKREKVFWVYVSVEYVMGLNIDEEEKKTVYFNDTDLISDLKVFHAQLMQIHEEKLKMNGSINENIITTNYRKRTEMYESLQEEWGYLDNVLKNDLKIVTDYMYPTAWKFGIAYQEGEQFNTVGIYQIHKGVNDVLIKDFSTNKADCFTVTYYRKDMRDIRTIINRQITELLKRYFEKATIPAGCLPDIVLEEIAFYFLDTLAKGCKEIEDKKYIWTYYRDQEEVSEIRRLWDALATPMDGIYADTIKELEARKMKVITRPWEPKKYHQMMEQYEKLNLRGLERRETGYLIEDIYSNHEKMLRELPEAYKFTSEKIWGRTARERQLKREYVICYDVNDVSCAYYKLSRKAYEFNIVLNEYSTGEIKALLDGGAALERYKVYSIKSSSFYSSCRLEMPLYSHIWYLLNLEMQERCNIKIPGFGLGYI